jgi:hemerythrin-like metal-binding protein
MRDRFGIKAKLLGLSLSLALMSVVVGVIGYFSSQRVESEYDFIVSKSVPKMELVSEMFLDYRQVHIALQTLGLSGLNKGDADAAMGEVQDVIKKYEESNTAYVGLGFINGQKELYETTNFAWQDFKKISEKVMTLYRSGTLDDRQKITSIFLRDCPEKAKAFRTSIQNLNAFHKEVIANKTKAAEEFAQQATNLSLLFMVFALIFGFAIGLFISATTAKELKSIVIDLMGNANEVSGTVSDLTSSSEALSSAASDQASAIQETAASIEEIRAMVKRNAESATESSRVSAQSKEEASLGKQSVNEMIVAMRDINSSNQIIQDEVQNGNRKIVDIVKIIQEIESKTKVINEIVFQTKLLSFNASVEAARAGEHGKGFAVVAEEVGNLANMSGNAAQEITTLLTQSAAKVNEIVQETTARVASLMKEARTKVERGSQVAEGCGVVLEKIVSNADHLSQMVESISSASHEQSTGVDEIARAIQQLDAATQTNAAETQNTAASAAHLGEQVKSLNGSGYRLQVLIAGGANSSGTIVNTFVWKKQYALGVHEMDEEHKVLIDKINLLASGINSGKNNSALLALFKDLAAYTKKHFSDEESYMSKIRYPDLANHKIVHQKLIAQIVEYEGKIANDDFDSGALISFLNDWLIKHILGVDMRYAQFSKTGIMTRSRQAAAS